MMSRLSQVIQMGEVKDGIHFYIEDYAYTYLKKQKGKEIAKYFLYGEQEREGSLEKLYIYGIGEKPKLEQSYFKEYYPIGYLKIKEEKAYWISLQGREEEITGCFLFYASNQAMQDYLVDHRQEETSEVVEVQKRKKIVDNEIPMKEVWVATRKVRSKRYKEDFKNEKFILPVFGIFLAALILVILVTPNGRKKAEIMKEVIAQTVSDLGVTVEDDFSIEEKPLIEEYEEMEETMSTDSVWDVQEEVDKIEENQEEMMIEETEVKEEKKEQVVEPVVEEKNISEEEVEGVKEENDAAVGVENVSEENNTAEKDADAWDEYTVKQGDTLVAICKIRYGSTAKMQEICEINNIKNADYIAPGQKIYLP